MLFFFCCFLVGVVNDRRVHMHYLGSRFGDIVEVDRDVVAGPVGAFGGAAQPLRYWVGV